MTPGPPLPKSHPSPALAAKLHLECAAFYSSARALVKTPGASRPSVSPQSKSKFKLGLGKDKSASSPPQEGADEVVPELRRYLADEVVLHNALAHKWLGVDAGEHGGAAASSGVAVGFLGWARKELEDLKGGAGGVNIGVATERERDMREARKARVLVEAESVSVFLKGYKRMNDSVGRFSGAYMRFVR